MCEQYHLLLHCKNGIFAVPSFVVGPLLVTKQPLDAQWSVIAFYRPQCADVWHVTAEEAYIIILN